MVERDYAQSYILLGIANRPELREALVFKGGTALKKIHFKTYLSASVSDRVWLRASWQPTDELRTLRAEIGFQ